MKFVAASSTKDIKTNRKTLVGVCLQEEVETDGVEEGTDGVK